MPDLIEDILWEEQKGKCFYCKSKLDIFHVDHKIPLSRGGLHDENNLCLACPSCNLKKHAKTEEEFRKVI